MIAAMDVNNGIGKDNALPWRCGEDLMRFKALTEGCVCVMGRNTFDSLKGLLPERRHVVITSNVDKFWSDRAYLRTIEDIDQKLMVVDSFKKAMVVCNGAHDVPRIWFIGGKSIYDQAIDIVDEVWLTRMVGEWQCDTKLMNDEGMTKLYENFAHMTSPPADLVNRFGSVDF